MASKLFLLFALLAVSGFGIVPASSTSHSHKDKRTKDLASASAQDHYPEHSESDGEHKTDYFNRISDTAPDDDHDSPSHHLGASADSNPASVDVGAAAVASHPADQELADAPVVPKGNAGAIECFQCNSLEDASCEKTHKAIKEKYLKPCPIKDRQSAIGCWKLSQKVDYDQNEELTAHERVVRQCAYIGQDAPCANRAGVGGITNQCFCNTTRCNHSAGLRGSPIFALVSTFVVLFLAKLAIA